MIKRIKFPNVELEIVGIHSLTRIKKSLFKGEIVRMVCQQKQGHPMDTWPVDIKVVGIELANKFGKKNADDNFFAEVIIWDQNYKPINKKIYFNTKTRQGGVLKN